MGGRLPVILILEFFQFQSQKTRNSNTRLPTPETAFSLCAGISGNGGQVEIRNNDQIHEIQMTETWNPVS